MSAEKKAQVLQLEPPQELIFKGGTEKAIVLFLVGVILETMSPQILCLVSYTYHSSEASPAVKAHKCIIPLLEIEAKV